MADVFISHASEDKDTVARPLADGLKLAGWEVWLDEDILKIGDRLSTVIGAGLAGARYGVVVLSRSFFDKAWPKRELEALLAREVVEKQDLLLPVWHGLTATEIAARSELLADRKSIPTAGGLQPIVAAITRVLRQEPPNNIPKLFDAMVGRDDELADVSAALKEHRLVTIRGGAGVGKSRLATELGTKALSEPWWGVWFVSLADVTRVSAANPSLLPAEVGRAMRIPEQRTSPPLEGLIAHLSSGRHLIVLDNCEHVADACRELIDHLVPLCPGLHVLATSRTPIGALDGTGEFVFDLAALQTGVEPATAGATPIGTSEAVRLFEIRARTRSSSFVLDQTNARDISRLCEALEGNPLAIELAAARLSVHSVEQLIEDARNWIASERGLRAQSRRRWDSLTAAVKWSVDLLSEREQACAAALSVFEGGWTEDAAGPVWIGAPPTGEVTRALQTLYDCSLVETRDVGKRKRFRYFEAVRQYLLATVSTEELTLYQRRHAQWFCTLSAEAASHFLDDTQREWLDRIEAEIGNLRVGVQSARTRGDAETVLKFLSALWRFAEIRGYYDEWRRSARLALEMPEAQGFPDLRSKVHSGAGMLAYRQADFDEAHRHFQESLEINVALGDQAGTSNALNDLGNVANMRGDFEQARTCYRQVMEIEIARNNPRAIAVAHFNLGTVSLALGDEEDALVLYADSLRGFEGNGNLRESAFALFGLAQAYIASGDLEAAREYGDRSLRIRVDVGDRKGEGDTHRILGWLEIEAGNMATASEHLVASLKRAQELGDNRGISEALAVAAVWCARQQRFEHAVRLDSAAAQIGGGLTFAKPAMLTRHGLEALADARRGLSERVYKRVTLDGKVLTPARAAIVAIEQALAT